MTYTKTNYPNIFTYNTTKGKRYHVRRTCTIKGKKKEITKSNLKTLQEARLALAEIERKIEGNEYDPAQNITCDQYWELYANNRIETGRWSPDTVLNKERIYNLYFSPTYGKQKIKAISRDDYELFINAFLTTKTRHTVKQMHGVFCAMLNDAKRNKHIPDNAIDGIYIGQSKKPAKDKRLSLADFKIWDKTARETLDDYQYTMVRLTYLGLRKSEVNGIKLGNLTKQDNDRYTVKLDDSRTRMRPNGGGMKTRSSERYIVTDLETAQLLDKAIRTSQTIAIKNNRILGQDDFLFLSNKGTPIGTNYLARLFETVSKHCPVHVTPHMMRHFYATQGQIAGVPVEHMAAALGHSTSYMTQKYTHIKDEVSASVTDSFIQSIQ